MRVIKTFFILGCLVLLCSKNLQAQKEIFIKQIDFELSKISDIEYENEFFMTMKFNKGSKYVFKIINNINDRPGVALLEVLDADNLIVTNELNDNYYETVTFLCSKTDFYDVLVRFKDNKLGYCQIDVVLVQ